MTKFVTGQPLLERERPHQRSIQESAAAVKAHANRKRRTWQPPQPKGRDDDLLRKGSQEEAQASQKIATKRYDPHGYD